MKKNLKKNFKRWIAFLLAVVLITTTCVYSSDSFLRAEGEGMDVESQAEPASEEVEVTPTEVEDSEDESDSDTDESDSDADDFEEEETDEDEEEVSEGEDVETSDEALDEENVEESDVESEETTEEKAPAPGEETGETYSYAIYYYFDGVEDEDARVEKENGVLGEKVLDADSVEKEVTHNDESYELDRIENGEITEEVESNVASVYYVLANETNEEEEEKEEKEYSLEFVEPSEGATVTIASIDGKEGGEQNTYKENTKITFDVSVDDGYEIPLVRDHNDNNLEPEFSSEESGKYTYAITLTDNTVITIIIENTNRIRSKSKAKSIAETAPTDYYISFRDGGSQEEFLRIRGDASYVKLKQIYYKDSAPVDEECYVVDAREIARNYPTITYDGKVYTSKTEHDGAATFVIPAGEPDEDTAVRGGVEIGTQEYLVLVEDSTKTNVIYLYYMNPYEIKNKVKVLFDAMGGTPGLIEWEAGEAGTAIPDYSGMPEVSKDGYRFLGWYDNREYEGNPVTDLRRYPEKDTTYYAKWAEAEAKYQIQHYQETLDGEFELIDIEYENGEIGSPVNASPKTYDGFDYNPDANGTITIGTILADGSLVLKLYYVRKNFTVTYVLNGGTVKTYDDEYEEQNGEVVFSVKYGSVAPRIEPEKSGYRFAGWDKEIISPVTESATYSAKYTRDTSEFSVESYEGEYDTDQHQVNVDSIISRLADGEKIQYRYNGEWLDSSAMKNNWPRKVTEDNGLVIPVRVVKGEETIWESPEDPYVKIIPREVTIVVPDAEKVYSRLNDYTFTEERSRITYTYDVLSLDQQNTTNIDSELSFIKSLGIKRIDSNKDQNEVTKYAAVLELEKSEQELNTSHTNFNFHITRGDLTITTKKGDNALGVVLKSETGSDGITYDGEMHFVTFKVTLDGEELTKEEAEEQGVEFIYTSGDEYISEAQKDVVNKLVQVTARRDGYEDAKSDAVVVKITPKKVIVKASNATTVLVDGATITYENEGEISVEGLISGDSIGVDGKSNADVFDYPSDETFSRDSVGIKEGVVTLTYKEEDINPNYTVKLVPGNLDVRGIVTYDANDWVSGNVKEDSLPKDRDEYSYGKPIPVKKPQGVFKKNDATFLGWTNGEKHLLVKSSNEIPTGMLTPGSTLNMGNQNITLYAVWAQDSNNDDIPDYEQYQVIYDLNGGDGRTANPKPEDTGYYDAGKSVTLVSYNGENAVKPTKEDAVFVGWSAHQSVQGQVYEIDPTEEHVVGKVTFDENSPTDITVYAVWAKDTNGPEGNPDGIADYLEHSVAYSDSRFGINAPVDNNLYPEDYEVTLKEGLSAPSSKADYELISFDSWKNDNVILSTDEPGKVTFIMPDTAVTFDAQWKYLTISKDVESKEGGYKVGENMLFTITVKNEGDVDLTGIEVSEKLKDAKLVDGENVVDSMQFDLAKGKSIKLRARYEVKDTDIQNKELTNTVEAVIGDDKAVATVDGTNYLADVVARLKVTKEIENQKTSYAVGDPITFKVTVRNIGSVTVKDITVTDSFENAAVEPTSFIARMVNKVREWFTGWEATNTSDPFDLKPNDKPKELTVTYIVQEEDLGHSGYWNVATAEGKSAIDDRPVRASGQSASITVDDSVRKVSLQKQVVEPSGENDLRVDGKYPVGSTVQYQVTVSNRGNTTLNEFMVNDQLTYADGSSVTIPMNAISNISVENEKTTVEWNGSGFRIGTLARNDTVVFTYTYTVQDSDAGKTINNAVVPGDGIEKEGEGGSSDPITVVEEELSVTKQVTSTPKADDGKYVLGELVTYAVTIENTGNVELTDIRVEDQFKGLGYGASLEEESKVIPSLPVNESVTLHYSYQIQEKDLGKTIANIATATVEDVTEGKNPEDQAVITTEDPEPQASIEKQIVSVESDGVVNNYQEGTMVKEGDTINYQITVTNTGNTTLENISISDQMNGNGEIKLVSGDASYDSEAGTFTIEKIEPNEDRNASKTITYSYKVVDKDKGSTIRNIAEIGDGVKDENGNTPSDEKEVTVENKLLEVIKEIEGTVPEDGYNTGDTVLFKVTVTNAGNVELTNIQVEDVMTGAEVEGVGPEASFVATAEMPTQTIDSLGVGESKTLTYQYTVRAVDVDEKETPMNRATAKLGDEIEKPSEPIVIPIRGQEPAYKVEKKLHDAINGIFAGESIAYDIEIENIGNTTLSQVAINDVMSYVGDEESGVPQGAITVTSNNADWVNGQFILRDPLAWGSKVLIQYTYTVTEDDAGKTIRNTAYGTYGPTSSEDVTIQKKSVDVTKIAKTKKDKYALGETIEFEVIVENTGNVELSDIVVNDQMQEADAEADFVTCEGAIFENGEINQLAPNAKAILTYQYTIRENDFGKTLGNKVEAFVKSDPDIKDDDVVGGLNVVSPDPKVALEKTIIGNGTGEDGKYKVGDTINYQIVVANTGNTTLDNVIVKDTMSGATGEIDATVTNASIESSTQTGNGWEYAFKLNQSILPLDPSKPEQDNTVTISYTYTVKKDDVGKQIGNIAVVDGDDIIKEDPKNPDPIVVEKRELEVTKRVTSTPDDGEAYQLGEKITFEIVVKNAGNVTLNDIIVTDIMEGIEENAVVGTGGNTQEIQQLKAGESITLEYFAYTVKEEALKAPSDADAIKNTVIARAKDGTEGYAETEYLKIGAQNPDFEVAKEVTREGSAEGGRYSIGEAIPYKIVVTNTGNVTLRNIVVKDTMTGATGEISKVTGATWNDRMGSFIINDPIAVGETAEINYSYVVQPEDVGKEIVNVATGKPFNPGSQTITEIEDRNLIVDKTLTSSPANPARGYVAGERITFDVRVANAGNVTLSGISITDEMQNAVGKADLVDANGNILNDDSDKNITLAVGENKILHYSYTVQRGDEEGAESDIVVGGKTIANKAIASINDGKPIGGTTEDTSSEASIDRLHTLTVYYQYADGSTAAVTLTQDFAYGDSFAFTIPAIGGYTATLGGETVQGAVMFVSSLYNDGDPDPVFTVIYNAIPEEEPTVTPTPTPDGEGTDPGDDTPVPPTPPVDEEPEEPVPEPVIVPVVPATVAAPGILGGGAGLVAIGDDPVPLDGVITQDDDGNIVIVPVDEVEVPLANREIDDHKCCILSFLLMLATLVIYSCFTHSMKKRQKKLAELKDQLAEETLKRQLGITDETSSRR